MGRIISLIRYRFFLFAGILPYLLGQVLAFYVERSLSWGYFWLGLIGTFLVLAGVEFFNEYFDAKEGSDRIFLQERVNVPCCFYPLGITAFLMAFIVGLYLSFAIGWLVLIFSLLGFLGAYFYVGPPVRWAYRGLGEAVIGLCYGPFMVLGSYYLQRKSLDFAAFFVSLIPGLFIFSLAIINEIPDYIQDRLVGKHNLVVKLGRKRALNLFILSISIAFTLLVIGVGMGLLPVLPLVSFLILPLIFNDIRLASQHIEQPKWIIPAIRTSCLTYITTTLSLGLGLIIHP